MHPTDEFVGARMGKSLVPSYSRAAVLILLRELLCILCPLSLLLLIVVGGRVGSGVLPDLRAVAGKLGDGTRYHVRDLALCIPHERIAVRRAKQLFWYCMAPKVLACACPSPLSNAIKTSRSYCRSRRTNFPTPTVRVRVGVTSNLTLHLLRYEWHIVTSTQHEACRSLAVLDMYTPSVPHL